MIETKIHFDKNPKEFLDVLSSDIRKGFRAGMMRATSAAEAVVVEEAPVREGNLRDAVMSTVKGEGVHVTGYVTPTAPYSEYVHRGTGIYGPYGTPIIPRKKKALAFTYGGRTLVRKSVRGQKPNPFVTRAKKRLEEGGILGREFWAGFNSVVRRQP